MKYVENNIARLGSTLTRIIDSMCAVHQSHRVAHKDAHQLTTTLVRSLDQNRDRDLGTALDLSFTMATHAAILTGATPSWSPAESVSCCKPATPEAKTAEALDLASGLQSADAMSEIDHLLGSDSGTMYASAMRLSQDPATRLS